MIKSVKAIIDKNGTVQVLEPLKLDRPTRAVIMFQDDEDSRDEAEPSAMAVLSEAALADWNKPADDEAWEHLQNYSLKTTPVTDRCGSHQRDFGNA